VARGVFRRWGASLGTLDNLVKIKDAGVWMSATGQPLIGGSVKPESREQVLREPLIKGRTLDTTSASCQDPCQTFQCPAFAFVGIRTIQIPVDNSSTQGRPAFSAYRQ
ncbi:2083_t:CDS:2, partial [Acaulospora colombiana]